MNIILPSGLIAQVSKKDFVYLNQFKWHHWKSTHTTYVRTKIKGKISYMHRMILPTAKEIDHKDANGLNNKRNNLRPCTTGDNNKNKKGYGKSKYKGVTLVKGKYWAAQIIIKGIHCNLGYHKTEIEAAKSYNRAALKTKDPFYRLNII